MESASKELTTKTIELLDFLLHNQIIDDDTYKYIFPSYDKLEIHKWLKVLKHFGPGNYCLFISLLLLFI